MLLSKNVLIKWTKRTKRHYMEHGHIFTSFGEEFEVPVEHLTKAATDLVKVKCDFCGKEFNIRWVDYNRRHNEVNVKDCCNDDKCRVQKQNETMMMRYGVVNSSNMKECIEKRKKTCMKKYGVDNPAKSPIVLDKIKRTNMNKRGYEWGLQDPQVREKITHAFWENYGASHFMKTEKYRMRMSGENSPTWKGGITVKSRDYSIPEYHSWRKECFSRDNYTCQACGVRSTKGKPVTLNCHHILNWADNESCRYDPENGITLCQDCHIEFHKRYGKRNTTREKLNEFLKMKRYAELSEIKPIESEDKKLSS